MVTPPSNDTIRERFAALTTAHVTDGCVRAGLETRCVGLTAVIPGTRMAGRVLPARHSGSVDVFLEAFDSALPGDVLCVDNAGRTDESCVGDLVTLEALGADLGGIAIWGLNRDTTEIRAIGLPVFSLGMLPTGPLHHAPRASDALDAATLGEFTVSSDDIVFGDADGIVFVPADRVDEVLTIAEQIFATESAQAERIRAGASLRSQVQFGRYLADRAQNPALTFREHLRTVHGEVEV